MGIEGPLSELNVIEVYQLVHMSKRTGVLRVDSLGRTGWAQFIQGRMVAAELHDGERKTLEDAVMKANLASASDLEKARLSLEALGQECSIGVALRQLGVVKSRDLLNVEIRHLNGVSFEMFTWIEGSFNFQEMPLSEDPEGPGSIATLTENVIMEGSRRIDEWSLVRKHIPSTDAVPKLRSAGDEAEGHIDFRPDEWRVLTLVDGRRTVKEIAQSAGWDVFQTSKLLYGLSVMGIVAMNEAKPLREERPDASGLVQAAEAYRRGDFVSSAKLLRAVVQEEKEHREAWVLLGNCYYRLADYASASKSYEEALRLERKDKGMVLSLGLCWIWQGRLKEAVHLWREAAEWKKTSGKDDVFAESRDKLEQWVNLLTSFEP